ncbi:MAG: lytic transglycosylase domain-containing protein [Bdellovibrionota bacterium]
MGNVTFDTVFSKHVDNIDTDSSFNRSSSFERAPSTVPGVGPALALVKFMVSTKKTSAQALSLITILAMLAQVNSATANSMISPVHELGTSSRLLHAKELLGKYYGKSIVQTTELITDVYPFIQKFTEKALPSIFKGKSDLIAQTILRESEKYSFDPVFVLAVITHESRFDPKAKGQFGEVGLMQLKPTTAKWIADRFDISFKGLKSLRNPVTNIQLGTAFLSLLRDRFDSHSQLYLAAYNMGATNVNRALKNQTWPKTYPIRVMNEYVKFYTEIALIARANLASPFQNAPLITGPAQSDPMDSLGLTTVE